MNLKFRWGLLIVFLLTLLPLFGNLDRMPLQLWDESRLAESAREMSINHQWFVTYFDGKPDMWNTKPPLMIWLQVASMKIIGINEIGSRLPAALAAAFTCFLLFWFFAKKMNDVALGLLTIIVLLCTSGYICPHGVRTGDYDALLVLCTTAYALFFFHYLEEGNRKYLVAFFVAMALGCLTKGVAALLFTPALFVYALTRKQTLKMLTTPAFYLSLLGFVAVVAGYYALREHQNPGYWAAVMDNELGGRYNTVLENHGFTKWFYWDALISHAFKTWMLALLGGAVIGLLALNSRVQRLTAFPILLAGSHILILSNASTKLDWYLLPEYPFLAFLVALLLWAVCQLLSQLQGWQSFMRYNLLPVVFVLLVCLIPYQTIISETQDPFVPSYDKENVAGAMFLKQTLRDAKKADTIRIAGSRLQNILFYAQTLEQVKKWKIDFVDYKSLAPGGSDIVVYESDAKKFLDSNFHYKVVDFIDEGAGRYKIVGRKLPDEISL